MSDDTSQNLEQARREQREAQYVAARLKELYENPLAGIFDVEHLKRIHAYIFQDLPEHRPGSIRERTEDAWIKDRVLEGERGGHVVFYARDGIEAKISQALTECGGVAAIAGQELNIVADRLAKLYGDLDYAHGFYEGNSRTLREFTRELALAGGYTLDWVKVGVGREERSQLYRARDLAVFERAFPGLNEERAMTTDDRAEYEAWFDVKRLRREVGQKSLAAIIRGGLTQEPHIDRPRDDAHGWER